MTDEALLQLLHDAADAVGRALGRVKDWGPSGLRPGQYRADLETDAAALAVLRRGGVGILSEESGVEHPDRPVMVVVDPLDGSTNASQGLPWFATALCALDADGPRAALVVHQGGGPRFTAVRGGGAHCNGHSISPSRCTEIGSAIVGLNGLPDRHYGWAQYRTLGAASLDLCAVASGVLDGYVDCVENAHGVWDYAAAALICHEAGASCSDAFGRELFVRDHSARRTPVAAATSALHRTLLAARSAQR